MSTPQSAAPIYMNFSEQQERVLRETLKRHNLNLNASELHMLRTRLAQNPSDGVDVANTICSLVPNGAVAVAGTLILRALGV